MSQTPSAPRSGGLRWLILGVAGLVALGVVLRLQAASETAGRASTPERAVGSPERPVRPGAAGSLPAAGAAPAAPDVVAAPGKSAVPKAPGSRFSVEGQKRADAASAEAEARKQKALDDMEARKQELLKRFPLPPSVPRDPKQPLPPPLVPPPDLAPPVIDGEGATGTKP